MTLERLALSRATLDRAAHRRGDPGLVEALLADVATAVLLLDADRGPVAGGPAGPRLTLLDPATALQFASSAWPGEPPLAGYLGDDRDGRPHVVLARTLPARKGLRPGQPGANQPSQPNQPEVAQRAALANQPNQADPPAREVEAPAGAAWAGLREVGALLDDTDAGLLTAAVALAHWHAAHPHCSRCGAPTAVVHAGWARSCPDCGAEHYPRTDGAVIMAVTDDDDRILLGRQTTWPPLRHSCLAGFVEPGESLEAAVRREVREEAGIEVGDVSYRGSQPWPFPASLMLGFRAQALTTDVRVDGAELASARWWSREELALDIATGELLLPPPVSIARRLIEEWYGGPIRDGGVAWR